MSTRTRSQSVESVPDQCIMPQIHLDIRNTPSSDHCGCGFVWIGQEFKSLAFSDIHELQIKKMFMRSTHCPGKGQSLFVSGRILFLLH